MRAIRTGIGIVLLLSASGMAQSFPSPEVHANGTVTFRLAAPHARQVLLAMEGSEPQPLQKDGEGNWSLTTDVLQPDLYAYSFLVDGVRMLDPSNPLWKPNLLNPQNLVHVPGPASLPWEIAEVPRGTLHHHFYRSKIVGDDRDFFVYTPPGYDPQGRTSYPVLYLLHGFSDDASAWTAVGRAHVILDNLIARGRANPMLLVMPLGYGAPEIVSRGFSGIRDEELRKKNYEKFRQALREEVIPQVERGYRVRADRRFRAIAGLSMGGAEALYVGLNGLEEFAWIGAFSTGGLGEDFEATFPGLTAGVQPLLGLLWMACGTEDRLLQWNRHFRDWLQAKGIRNTYLETPGAHTWRVWRRHLAEFLPLLFRD